MKILKAICRKVVGGFAFCRKHFQALLRILVVAVLIFAGGVIGVYLFGDGSNMSTSKVTELGLKNIGELYTQVGYYTTIVKSPLTADALGIKLPFTDSNYIFTCDGEIKAGYNFSEIEIRVDKNTIFISLPEPIIYNKIDHESFVVIDEDKNIFTPLTPERMNEAFLMAETEAQEKAVANGLLENAEANACVLLESFLAGLYDMEIYSVKYNE